MAVNDFTGKNIQNTYQRVVQTDGTSLADGTGSLLPISFRGNDVVISGSLIAQTYVVSESIVNISSGSTVFGDSGDDSHFFSGSITASGDISSSGNVYANQYWIQQRSLFDYSTSGELLRLGYNSDTEKIVIGRTGVTTNGIILDANVTASGNISASGDINGNAFKIHNLTIADYAPGAGTRIGIYNEANYYRGRSKFEGHITASGNISASGAITALSSNIVTIEGGTF